MEYHASDWLGRWQNFEAYLTSTDPHLTRAWAEAEAAAAKMPMFRGGVQQFWKTACAAVSPENPHPFGGWNITAAGEDALCIEWLDPAGASLGSAIYRPERILKKGLEGKENFLFRADDAAADWPFRCLLAMEPMPARSARASGGLLSHLHFQYASRPELLFDPETGVLRRPMWYPTVCDGDGTLLEQCNIVLALHHLPVWTELPAL